MKSNQLVRRIFIILVGVIVSLVLLELGLRVYLSAFGSEDDKAAYLYSAEEIIANSGRYQGEPYINFGLSPNHPDHNHRGYRGEELQNPKSDDTFRIVALGGSTTFGINIDAENAYPTWLQRVLHDEYGFTNVEVVNGGVPSYSSFDTLANFAYRVLDDEPDMIIVYHAINDVIVRLVDPEFYNGLNPIRGIWSPPQNLSPFALVRFISIRLGQTPNPNNLEWALLNTSDAIRCTDSAFCVTFGMTPQEVLDANPPIYFERNLRNLIALAQANDVDVVLSSWAYLPEPSNGNLFMTYEHMQSGVAEHNAIIEQLAEEFQLPFYDLFTEMPYEPNYWLDGLHLNEAGSLEQARLYAVFLVENNLIPEPR